MPVVSDLEASPRGLLPLAEAPPAGVSASEPPEEGAAAVEIVLCATDDMLDSMPLDGGTVADEPVLCAAEGMLNSEPTSRRAPGRCSGTDEARVDDGEGPLVDGAAAAGSVLPAAILPLRSGMSRERRAPGRCWGDSIDSASGVLPIVAPGVPPTTESP